MPLPCWGEYYNFYYCVLLGGGCAVVVFQCLQKACIHLISSFSLLQFCVVIQLLNLAERQAPNTYYQLGVWNGCMHVCCYM